MNNITEKIMGRIENERLKMRPRWHFVAKAALALLGLVILILLVLFVAGFMAFGIRQSGLLVLPRFGWPGVGLFLRSFPWTIAFLLMAFMAGIELYARRFSFAYRRPVLITSALMVIVVVVCGAIIASQFRNGCMPPGPMRHAIGRVHEAAFRLPEHVFAGALVSDIEEGIFMMKTDVSTFKVYDATGRGMPPNLVVGDEVVVIGDDIDGVIRAYGIRMGSSDMEMPPRDGLFPCRRDVRDSPMIAPGTMIP